MSQEKLKCIDNFKGIAIIMVVATHFVQMFNEVTLFESLLPRFGQMGCQVFFVISAFTLCLSLQKDKKYSYFGFLKKRLIRIAPSYWLAIALTLFFSFVASYFPKSGFSVMNLKGKILLENIFLIHGFFPKDLECQLVRGGWFVGTIVVFYIFTPIIFFWIREKNEKQAIKSVVLNIVFIEILLIVVSLFTSIECVNNNSVYFSCFNQYPSFVLGILMWKLYESGMLFKIKYPIIKGCVLMLISVLLFASDIRFAFIIEPTVFSVAVLYILAAFLSREKRKQPLVKAYILSLMGKHSFAIYLIHPFVVYDLSLHYIGFVRDMECYVRSFIKYSLQMPDIYLYLLLLPFTCFFSYLAARVFELIANPFTNLIKKILS